MKRHLISIIVPVYNGSKYLERCINSILSQTYPDLEILLVNDGSTDDSLLVCQKYTYDSRVKVLDKPNGGVGSARNVGLDNAIGDYIMFVDSDDFISTEMCEKMISSAFEKSFDILFCGYSEMNEKMQVKAVDERQAFSQFVLTKDISILFNYNNRFGVHPYIWRVLYKADVVRQLRFNEKLYIGEDDIFLIQALLHADKVGYLDDKLYYYLQIGSTNGYYKYKVRDDYYEVKKNYSLILENILSSNGYNLLANAIRGRAYIDMVSSACVYKSALSKVNSIVNNNEYYAEAKRKKYLKALLNTQKDLGFAKKVQLKLCFNCLPLYVVIYKFLRGTRK